MQPQILLDIRVFHPAAPRQIISAYVDRQFRRDLLEIGQAFLLPGA